MIYSGRHGPAMARKAAENCYAQGSKMVFDDEDAKKPVGEFRIGEDLDAISIDELHERITAYEGEIDRLRQMIDEKQRVKGDADAVFRN